MSFVVYKSSAGSGKTFTLVKEYLRLVLPEPEKFRHILAITFTNKAANEMKERVIYYLQELIRPSSDRDPHVTDDIVPCLVKETGLDEYTVSQKAGHALRLILHDYSDFSIGTIDSFSHRVIRTFAHDFGLPVNFNVELDSEELLETAVDLLLDKVGDDPDLTRLLVKFLESRLDEERSSDVEGILTDFARVLLDEEGMTHVKKLSTLTLADFDRFLDEIYKEINAFETTIREIAEKAVDLMMANNLPASAFSQGDRGIAGYFMKLFGGRLDSLDSDKNAAKTVDEDKWFSGKVSQTEMESIQSIKNDLAGYFNRIRKIREERQGRYILFRLLTRTIYPLAVLNTIDRTLSEFKKQNNIIHISEFNRRIAEIVMNEPVPFIYERLGERYNHILIDEFQDTSRLQWSNLLPLVENSLASGHFNLVVGDGKQAIYRWRNGDAEQFTALPSIPGSDRNPLLREREETLRRNYQSYRLNTNYRSREVIVDFNNRFFTYLANQYLSELGPMYADVSQTNLPGKTGGYVSLELIAAEADSSDYRQLSLDRILGIIRECENMGYTRKEIAILCRKNRDAGEVARFLIENKIPVISAESLFLGHSPEVCFIAAMIRLMNGSWNPVLVSELITYLSRNNRIEGNLHHLLLPWKENKTSVDFLRYLKENGFAVDPTGLTTLPVFELCEELIRIFGLNTYVDPYLQFFLDAVMKYTRKNSSTPVAFLEWWEKHKNKLSVIIPEGLDAIRIMTVHKAKGLQFAVVIHPFANDRKDYAKPFIWFDLRNNEIDGLPAAMLKPVREMQRTEYHSEFEEEEAKSTIDLVNVLYVALTRPEEQLYILTKPPPKSSSAANLPSFFAGFLMETGQWQEGKMKYEFGKVTAKMSSSIAKSPGSDSLPSFISRNWRKKVFIRQSAPESWDIEDPQRNYRWGNLVHAALSRIETIDDLDQVLGSITASGMMDISDSERLKKTVQSIAGNPEVSEIFRKGVTVRKEAEILLKDGTILRPDRVIMVDDKATVVDYKTGKVREEHKNQVKAYGRQLLTMGYKTVNMYLLYTEPEVRLVEVE